jgi:late competence protein required for DNA uptake (superfamily II DNA/RNA helicase)
LRALKQSYQSKQDIIVAKHSSSGDTNQITVYGTHKLIKFKKQ